jgi:hypothetical protein
MAYLGSEILIETKPPGGAWTDITDHVQFSATSFETQLGAMPGTCTVNVLDQLQTLTFATGAEIRFSVDGVRMWGGYITQVTRKFAFPVVDTTTPSAVKARMWELTGVDYNILFDKRIIWNPSSPTTGFPYFGLDKTMGWLIENQLCANYLDLADDGLDTTTYVDSTFVPRFDADGNPDPDGTKDGAWPQQGSTWRVAMEQFAQYGCLYYIDADKNLHFHEVENIDAAWSFSDKPNFGSVPNITSTYPMREFEEIDDASMMINDAFVWGGSEWNGSGSTAYKRSQNASSISSHGRWQYAEVRFGDLKIQGEVTARANVIVSGNTTGAVGGDTLRGMSVEQYQVRCVWFGHDVPKVGGNRAHLRPGYVTKFFMYVHGDGSPRVYHLPIRSVRVSFITLDPSGNAYVRFEGFFGLNTSDPWWLWKFLRDTAGKNNTPAYLSYVSGGTSGMYGANGSFAPTPAPNGNYTTFTIPDYSYISGSLHVYKNGLLQTDVTETDPGAGSFTLASAPTASDTLWVTCLIAGGKS